jgi:undecaprenyl diphosphate synthase
MQTILQPTRQRSAPKLHVAIIMDGNGRWGSRRGLSRTAGHRAGVDAVRRVAEAAPDLGVETLTLFAFSSDNWRRPAEEGDGLMAILRGYLRFEVARLVEAGVRLTVIGRRDRLPVRMRQEIARVERATADGARLHLRLAIDYSARAAIAQAAARWTGEDSPECFSRLISLSPGEPVPDVDLLIRTSGEQRLSDFLLWESAYAELWFTQILWPDFGGADLAAAVAGFHARERRFGGVGPLFQAAAVGERH